MLPEHRPDRLEIAVRFVCGAVAGAVAGSLIVTGSGAVPGAGWLIAGTALAAGAGAAYWGDRFWRLILRLM